MTTPSRDVINRQDVLALFASQRWVASVDQLLELPVSRSTIDRSCRAGVIVRILPGVVMVAGAEDTFVARAMALQLAVGPDSYISGVSAGVLYGLRNMPRRRIEITAPHGRAVVMPPWGRLEHTVWVHADRFTVVRPDGLRVSSPLMTLFRMARTFNDHRFERAAEDFWHKQLLTPEEADEFLGAVRGSGRGGVLRFERWLQRCDGRERPSQSGLELDVVEAIRRAGLPEPQRQHPLTLRSGELIHVDLAWPEVRLGVEPGHTWWHGGDLRVRADEARDRACDEIGWRIVRNEESLRNDLPGFGLQLRIIYDERRRSLRPA
ncbi:MAG: hypothetical protein ACRDZ2_15820 [Ilumatobacteraceae bacterium]